MAKAGWSRAAGLAAGSAVVIAGVASAATGPGKYVGTTSERGAVTFTVPASGASIESFAASDGYNGKCDFHGGVGGAPNYSVSIPSIKIEPGGSFTATARVKLGPFSGTIVVKGKVTSAGATGTLDQVGATCGKGAGHPSMHSYLETFSAKKA